MIVESMILYALAAISAEGAFAGANAFDPRTLQRGPQQHQCTEVTLEYSVGGNRHTISSNDCQAEDRQRQQFQENIKALLPG